MPRLAEILFDAGITREYHWNWDWEQAFLKRLTRADDRIKWRALPPRKNNGTFTQPVPAKPYVWSDPKQPIVCHGDPGAADSATTLFGLTHRHVAFYLDRGREIVLVQSRLCPVCPEKAAQNAIDYTFFRPKYGVWTEVDVSDADVRGILETMLLMEALV